MNKTNILEYLEESAHRYGDKVALTDGADSLTFTELHRKAEAIGSLLLSKGIYRQAVSVLMDKHPDTVCAFLGVLYAGCFYVCADPESPDARILSVIESVRSQVIICSKKSRERAERFRGRAEVICFEDACVSDVDKDELRRVRARAIDTDPAYVVFTSGSTGEPKGVCASHRSVIDYAEALKVTLPFDENTVFGNQSPLYYDAPLKEILPMLSLGATVCFIPKELFMFPVRLCEFIKAHGISTLCWAASALAMVSSLAALEAVSLKHLRTVCFGSEIFPRGEYDKWRKACPDTTFINLYGPTEATGMSCYWIANRELEPDEPIPIGKPFPNTEIILIDEKGKASDEGEIYIRGSCVTLGYYGFNERTQKVFVQNPTNFAYPEIVYKTGDLAKINARGELVYLGRRDGQIKHMGRRIELGEIERSAESVVGISIARCVYDADNKRILLAYIGETAPAKIQTQLGELLPRYMLPSVYKRVDSLPQQPNGKVDRAELLRLLLSKEKK